MKHAVEDKFNASHRISEDKHQNLVWKSTSKVTKYCMDINRLKMNYSKTEFIMFGHTLNTLELYDPVD